MRKTATAALAALALMFGLLAPLSPAAAAAAITLRATASLTTDSYREFSAKATGFTDGADLTLQVLSGSTWKNTDSTDWADEDYTTPSFYAELARAGSTSFRVLGRAGKSTIVSNTVTAVLQSPRLSVTRGRGNTAYVKGTDAKGVLVRLYAQPWNGGRRVLVHTAKTATASSFTLTIPYKISKAGLYTVEAEGRIAGSSEVIESSGYDYQARAGTGPYKQVASVSTNTATVQPKKYLRISGITYPGDRVTAQRLSGKKWISIGALNIKRYTELSTIAYRIPREGTTSFRAIISKGGKTLSVSKARAIKYARVNTYAPQYTDSYTLFGKAEGRIAAGERTSTKVRVTGRYSKRTVYLQEYRKGKWVNLSKAATKKSGYQSLTFTSPKTTSTTTRKYRLYVVGTTYERPVATKTASLRHMNPRNYRGSIRTFYNYMKKYCPRQVIVSNASKWDPVSRAWSGSYRIEMSRVLRTGKSMQYVALHECAHIRTYRVYKNMDFWAMESRLDRVFGRGKGMEMVADCMSYRMGADIRYGGTYTKNCSGARGTAARKILAGQKV